MATARAMMSVGQPAQTAIRVGYEEVDLTTTAASTQGSGQLKGAGNKMVRATIHASNGSITLPTEMEPGDEAIIANVSATAGLIYPPTGGIINGNSANAALTLAATGSAGSSWWIVKITSTRYSAWAAADQT